MKKYNKFLSFVATLLMLLSFVIPVQAQEKEKLFVNFSEFQFVTDDYNPNEVHIKYEKVGMKENAYIIDNNGTVLETMR